MEEIIIKIIREVRPYEQIERDTELIKSGLLDSLAVIKLTMLLEDEFEIEIAEEEVNVENFCSVTNIVHLITKIKI